MKRLQTILIFGFLVPLVINFIIWQVLGGEIFTKTEVFVTKTDELLGTTYKEGVPGFIPGLDFFLLISLLEFALLFFVLRLLKSLRGKQ